MDLKNDEEQLKNATKEYSFIGELARDNGVTIHVIVLKSEEDCKIAAFSNLCNFTGGEIKLVSPS
jgi:hypothetical protein